MIGGSVSSYEISTRKSRWCLESPASPLFNEPFVQAHIKENIKAPRHWPLLGESTGDRWNSLAKSQ